MYTRAGLTIVALVAAAKGQQPGTLVAEIHPKITTQKCTKAGGCTSVASSVTLGKSSGCAERAATLTLAHGLRRKLALAAPKGHI